MPSLVGSEMCIRDRIGVTDEYDIGFYLKRARVAEQIFGTSEFHQARYADISGF